MQGGFGASNDAVNRIRKCLCKTEELSGSKDYTACGLWRATVLQKKKKKKKKKSMAAAVVTWWGKNGDIQLVRLQSLLSLMCREWWGSMDFMHFFFYASICSNFYISITFLILKYVQWVKAKPPRPAPLWSEPDWSFRHSSGQP